MKLTHELGGSVKELLAGAKLEEVTEPTRISLRVGVEVAKAGTGWISKRVASRRKVGGGD